MSPAFPIAPVLWLLVWLYRALKARGKTSSPGQRSAGKHQATRLTIGPSVTVALDRWSAEIARRVRDEEIHRISSANAGRY